VLDEKFYTDLPGGLMESLGQLFKNDTKLYVYPSLDKKSGQLTTVKNLEVAPHLRHLYAHLVENKFIEDITDYNVGYLSVYANDVREKIRVGSADLAKFVPLPVFEAIQNKKLFGWGGKS